MKTVCSNVFRPFSAFLKCLRTKPGQRDKELRTKVASKNPDKRRHRHGAFFEMP